MSRDLGGLARRLLGSQRWFLICQSSFCWCFLCDRPATKSWEWGGVERHNSRGCFPLLPGQTWERGGRQTPEHAARLRRCKGEGWERSQPKTWKRRGRRRFWGWNQLQWNPLLTPTPHTNQTLGPCPGSSSELGIAPASVSCKVRTHQTSKILLVVSQEQQHRGLH